MLTRCVMVGAALCLVFLLPPTTETIILVAAKSNRDYII
jgi:hypothetical protein